MTIPLKFLILVLFGVGSVLSQDDSTGIRLLEERKFQEAELYFRSILSTGTSSSESHYFLSVALLRQLKLDEAEEEVEKAIELNGEASKYHLVRGQILGMQAMNANILSQGLMAPKIKNAFLRASELDPENIEARLALFNYYVMAPGIMGGSEEKALEQAQEVLERNPFRGRMMLASYHVRVRRDTAEAERQIRSAIAEDPTRGAGYKQLGYLFLSRDRFREALTQMQRYIDLEPDNADAYDSYGDVLKAEKKFDQAIQKYLRALSVDKTFGASIFSLAECYEQQGEKQKAKETFQWFLTVEPVGRRANEAQKKLKEL